MFLTIGVSSVVGQSRPPAYVPCELYAGESTLFEGRCRVTTLRGGKVRIEEEEGNGYVFLVVLRKKNERVYWNALRNGKEPKVRLGDAHWLDYCWQSVPRSEVPFQLCLLPPWITQGQKGEQRP